MALNYNFVRNQLGAQFVVPAVSVLPSVVQARSVDINFATYNVTSGDTVMCLPVAAGFIVQKVYTIIMTASTDANLTAAVGYYYVPEVSGMPGTTATLGDADAFDASVVLTNTAQSSTVPGRPEGATLEATDTDAGAGVYFPVTGFISLYIGGNDATTGKVRLVAIMADAGKL